MKTPVAASKDEDEEGNDASRPTRRSKYKREIAAARCFV
jgi:hypothetical protein